MAYFVGTTKLRIDFEVQVYSSHSDRFMVINASVLLEFPLPFWVSFGFTVLIISQNSGTYLWLHWKDIFFFFFLKMDVILTVFWVIL